MIKRRYIPSLLTPKIFVAAMFIAAYLGVGGVLRLAFPALSCALGFYFLYVNRKDLYFELIIWLFMMTPCIRRMVDFKSGFEAINLLMLAPYAVAGLAIPTVFLKMVNQQTLKFQVPFLLIFVAIFYALLTDLFDGNMQVGVYNAITWLAPVCIGLFIINDPDSSDYIPSVIHTLSVGTLITSVYGIYQFVRPPEWDRYWMVNSGMLSIGFPEPFLIRVFGTMNSPGSFASWLAFAILFIAPLKPTPLRVIVQCTALVALLLTMVRVAWVGFIFGLAAMIIIGRSRQVKFSTIAAVGFLTLTISGLMFIPEVSYVLSDRLQSFTSLGSDASYGDRQRSLHLFFSEMLQESTFGAGFGNLGARAGYGSGTMSGGISIDEPIIVIVYIYGIIFGLIYATGVGASVLASIRSAMINRDNQFVCACASGIVMSISMLTGATTVMGETGLLFWLSIGFCLSSVGNRVNTLIPRQYVTL